MGETEPPPNQFFNPLEAVGTGGAQKCRGSGAPNPNQHPNHPLCHAMCAAAIFFEVMAKVWTVATSYLRFCRAGSDGVAFMVGALGFECAAGEGSMCTGRGLFLGLAVALRSKFMGIG